MSGCLQHTWHLTEDSFQVHHRLLLTSAGNEVLGLSRKLSQPQCEHTRMAHMQVLALRHSAVQAALCSLCGTLQFKRWPQAFTCRIKLQAEGTAQEQPGRAPGKPGTGCGRRADQQSI